MLESCIRRFGNRYAPEEWSKIERESVQDYYFPRHPELIKLLEDMYPIDVSHAYLTLTEKDTTRDLATLEPFAKRKLFEEKWRYLTFMDNSDVSLLKEYSIPDPQDKSGKQTILYRDFIRNARIKDFKKFLQDNNINIKKYPAIDKVVSIYKTNPEIEARLVLLQEDISSLIRYFRISGMKSSHIAKNVATKLNAHMQNELNMLEYYYETWDKTVNSKTFFKMLDTVKASETALENDINVAMKDKLTFNQSTYVQSKNNRYSKYYDYDIIPSDELLKYDIIEGDENGDVLKKKYRILRYYKQSKYINRIAEESLFEDSSRSKLFTQMICRCTHSLANSMQTCGRISVNHDLVFEDVLHYSGPNRDKRVDDNDRNYIIRARLMLDQLSNEIMISYDILGDQEHGSFRLLDTYYLIDLLKYVRNYSEEQLKEVDKRLCNSHIISFDKDFISTVSKKERE